ncbi:hypothetical protein [Cellulomonas sp. RIT-PI-Y]|uniref:hypothetical protein n=1 Tax=Cellulomonas sp. RIT-PI-Y TaxID=3035297 RepID=UPI0021D99942|nr:hypothetical protein [Cellulomonas sp. RIT-PI-Y]
MSTNDSSAAAVTDTAKEQVSELATGAVDSGQGVLEEAKEQAADVVQEAKGQARNLLGEARSGLNAQASEQQSRAASSLRSLGDELTRMADSSEQDGLATDLVRQAAGHTGSVATWLEDREPGDILSDVADFARKRPGVFLAVAAGAGVLAGRLTRGLKDAPSSGDTSEASRTTDTADLPAPTTAATDPVPVVGEHGLDTTAADEHGAEVQVGGEQFHQPESDATTAVGSEEQAWVSSGTGSATPVPAEWPPTEAADETDDDPLSGFRQENRP